LAGIGAEVELAMEAEPQMMIRMFTLVPWLWVSSGCLVRSVPLARADSQSLTSPSNSSFAWNSYFGTPPSKPPNYREN